MLNAGNDGAFTARGHLIQHHSTLGYQQVSAGRVLTFRFQVGELEPTPERLSVVHVNEVVNALLDHVRLRAERRDHLVKQSNRCPGATKMPQYRTGPKEMYFCS